MGFTVDQKWHGWFHYFRVFGVTLLAVLRHMSYTV